MGVASRPLHGKAPEDGMLAPVRAVSAQRRPATFVPRLVHPAGSHKPPGQALLIQGSPRSTQGGFSIVVQGFLKIFNDFQGVSLISKDVK